MQPSVFESARSSDFSSLPIIIEDWIKDNGGTYSGELSAKSYNLLTYNIFKLEKPQLTRKGLLNISILHSCQRIPTKPREFPLNSGNLH